MEILFYSENCVLSKNIVNTISRYQLNIQAISYEKYHNQFPAFIQSIP